MRMFTNRWANVKKFISMMIVGVVLLSGCNRSESDTESSSIPPSSDSETRINEQTTSAETSETSSAITVSESESKFEPEPESEPEQSTDKEENALNIEITVNGNTFSAALYENDTAKTLRERLPLTLDMSELNGNEKYYYLSESLPTNSSRPSEIHAGDIMLYGSDCLVIFYESFSTSYSYTPIGKINDPDGLAAALGSGSAQVTFH